jgi:DNA topoisomerase-1
MAMTTLEPIVEAVQDAGLVYTCDSSPGIRRERSGEGFRYFHPDGREVSDEETLGRIRSLAIPPAYEDVWICNDPKGHLQATGKDARGRKQYRYHPCFREVRDQAKFTHIVEFGKRLPRIRERVQRDMAKKGLPKEKVLAALVHLLEHSLIRVGNEEYAKTNKSYGLTTMRSKHVKVEGSKVSFRFLGKSKVRHEVELSDRKLARIVRKLQDLPGQELFQYVNEEGKACSVSSQDVNAYLKSISNAPYTAKDFRTWAATVLCAGALAGVEVPATKKELKATMTGVVREVAERLGNTPTVCRACYIHPAVLDSFTVGRLRKAVRPDLVLEDLEASVLRLLRRYQREHG